MFSAAAAPFTSPPAVYEGSDFPTSCQRLFSLVWIIAVLVAVK